MGSEGEHHIQSQILRGSVRRAPTSALLQHMLIGKSGRALGPSQRILELFCAVRLGRDCAEVTDAAELI